MIIRFADLGDLPRIIEIYNQAVLSGRSTADLTPIRMEERLDWFSEHTPKKYPIFVAMVGTVIGGWCSLSPYRPGRMALRFTAEISCYIDQAFHRQGIATALINQAMIECPTLKIKTIFGILLECNTASIGLMQKLDFELWGRLPRVADFKGEEWDHLYFGKRVWDLE
jgi:phosphinothricin acetyltransferase